MKYGIVGNRQGWNRDFVAWKISDIIFNDKSDEISEVTIISGGAAGVDSFAIGYAMAFDIEHKEFLPDPKEEIPERYFNRNKKIAEECDVLIAFDMQMGHSGTKNTIKYAKELGKEIIIISEEEEWESSS